MITILETISETIKCDEELPIPIEDNSKRLAIEAKAVKPLISRPTYPEHPVCFYYWINKWRVKEIIIDNKIYHLIGKCVYFSDGRFYMGTYDKEYSSEINTMAMDPDEVTAVYCPCFIRKQLRHIKTYYTEK